MKNIIVLASLFLSLQAVAQKGETTSPLHYTCDNVSIDQSKDIIELKGQVYLETDKIKFENAEKIIFYKKENELVVSSPEKCHFLGAFQVKNKGEKKTIRYVVGDNIAYIE